MVRKIKASEKTAEPTVLGGSDFFVDTLYMFSGLLYKNTKWCEKSNHQRKPPNTIAAKQHEKVPNRICWSFCVRRSSPLFVLISAMYLSGKLIVVVVLCPGETRVTLNVISHVSREDRRTQKSCWEPQTLLSEIFCTAVFSNNRPVSKVDCDRQECAGAK